MNSLKIISLLSLTLIVGCELTNERAAEEEVQDNDQKAQEIVSLAKKLVEQKRKLQPNSWDVSLEESFKKDNPLRPPSFALKSGTPPKLKNPNLWDAGLWNCTKLTVGKLLCDLSSLNHMVAQHFAENANGDVIGQVAVFAPGENTLVASCKESASVNISIGTRLNSTLYSGDELVVTFDNESYSKYEFTANNKQFGTFDDTQQLLAKLMTDATSMKVQSSSENNESNNSARFIVKNFPRAWEVACGWHLSYDAKTGIDR